MVAAARIGFAIADSHNHVNLKHLNVFISVKQ